MFRDFFLSYMGTNYGGPEFCSREKPESRFLFKMGKTRNFKDYESVFCPVFRVNQCERNILQGDYYLTTNHTVQSFFLSTIR